MAQYVAFDRRVEVNGQTVFSVVDGMGAFKGRAFEILRQAGIDNPQPGEWYRQQDWLDAFRVIGETVGSNTLFGIGKKIPENADFPPEIDNIVAALASIDIAYHMNHRIERQVLFNEKTGRLLEGIGHYTFKRLGDTTAQMFCQNPYPCDFDRGIIVSMATRFKPEDSLFTKVDHLDDAPCRKKAGEFCTYQVAW